MRKRWDLENADRNTVLWISLAVVALLAAVIVSITLIGRAQEKNVKTTGIYGDISQRFSEAPAVEYKGGFYRPYENLTSILLMGVDRYSDTESTGISFRNGGQADYLQLLVINDDTQTMTPIQIDRDTMAKITILGVLGDVTGTRVVQICLSHGFGDGKDQSCRLTEQAVSWLLNDITVDFYISMEMDGISTLNDAVGGITVTLEDDFSIVDPDMVLGTTLTLHGKQAEYFVRGRMNIGIGTNQARMARQKVFMNALTQIISQRIHESGSAQFVDDLLSALDPYLLTDMKRGRIINTAWNTRDYTQLDPVRIEGQAQVGAYGYNEFHVDEDALNDLIMQVFYYPVEAAPET